MCEHSQSAFLLFSATHTSFTSSLYLFIVCKLGWGFMSVIIPVTMVNISSNLAQVCTCLFSLDAILLFSFCFGFGLNLVYLSPSFFFWLLFNSLRVQLWPEIALILLIVWRSMQWPLSSGFCLALLSQVAFSLGNQLSRYNIHFRQNRLPCSELCFCIQTSGNDFCFVWSIHFYLCSYICFMC